MSEHNPDELPIRRALIWIAVSLTLVCGAFFATYFSIHLYENLRAENPRYTLREIIPQAHRELFIPVSCFYEWLEIDPENPVNLYSMNRAQMEKKLSLQPLLEKVRVAKEPPSTLVIDYWPRMPVAILADQTETLLDGKGRAIPSCSWMKKERVEVFLGEKEPVQWGESVKDWGRVRELISMWDEQKDLLPLILSRLDVSHLDHPSAGGREVIFTLKSELGSTHFLRLPVKNLKKQLHSYVSLCHHWLKLGKMEQDWIVDLRVDERALVKSEGRHE